MHRTFPSIQVSIGGDPELFLRTSEGRVLESAHVIPAEGAINPEQLKVRDYPSNKLLSMEEWVKKGIKPALTRDGVQVELHPQSSGCRQSFAGSLMACFRTLKHHLDSMKGVAPDFTTVITLSRAEHAKLSPSAKELGCSPSKNIHDASARIKINPATYKRRSAAGHLHFGTAYFANNRDRTRTLEEINALAVQLLDLGLGSTCVMFDRDPNAALRRRVYGKAGEYRDKPYGLEYRTLSNFWLRSYPLTSFVLGMGRMMFAPLYLDTRYGEFKHNPTILKDLLNLIPPKRVAEVINTNDLAGAKENWKILRGYLEQYSCTTFNGSCSADKVYSQNQFDAFEHIASKPIEKWWPESPYQTWQTSAGYQSSIGWENFLAHTHAALITKKEAKSV